MRRSGEMPPGVAARACQYVVGYEDEPAGSDVADPRIRCGEPATVRVGGDEWLCVRHAKAFGEQGRATSRDQ